MNATLDRAKVRFGAVRASKAIKRAEAVFQKKTEDQTNTLLRLPDPEF
jgi:hypothetical protein